MRLSTFDFRAMLLINLIFEFCVIIVQAGCTPLAWLLSDLATSPLVCNLYILHMPSKPEITFGHRSFSEQKAGMANLISFR